MLPKIFTSVYQNQVLTTLNPIIIPRQVLTRSFRRKRDPFHQHSVVYFFDRVKQQDFFHWARDEFVCTCRRHALWQATRPDGIASSSFLQLTSCSGASFYFEIIFATMSRDRAPRVFLGRLPRDIKEKDVEKFFRGFGRIREINLKNGFGFVVSLLNKLNLSNTLTSYA